MWGKRGIRDTSSGEGSAADVVPAGRSVLTMLDTADTGAAAAVPVPAGAAGAATGVTIPIPVPAKRNPRASWHTRANAIVLGYLAAAGLSLVAADALPSPRWLAVHLFGLGAVTNAIVTWSEHFATTLLRAPAPSRRQMAVRLLGLNAGVVTVIGGVATDTAPVVLAGATVVAGVVAVHAGSLTRRSRRALQTRFGAITRFYVAAAGFLLAGIVFGTLLGTDTATGVWVERLHAAHVHTNVLGWVALTVLGTEFTLWPTALRTRMVEGTRDAARRTFALTVVGLAVAVGSLLTGSALVTAAGLTIYAGGVAVALVPLVRTGFQRHPHTAATWLLAAGTTWLAIAVLADIGTLLRTRDVVADASALDRLVPVLLVGFVAQVLTGALSFLLPVVLGRGPGGARQATATLERLWLPRIVAINVGVLAVALPAPSWIGRAGWALIAIALGAFVLLAASLIVAAPTPAPPPVPPPPASSNPSQPTAPPAAAGRHRSALVGGALVAVVVLVAAAITFSGQRFPTASPAVGRPAAGAGATQVVAVSLGDMVITPRRLEVAAGTTLVLDVTNRDRDRHDLKIDGGPQTRRLAEGETQRLEVGPVTRSRDGWCTVAGHRAAGMTMTIAVSGSQPGAAPPGASSSAGTTAAAPDATIDPKATPGAGWSPYSPVLAPVAAGTEHAVTLHVVERSVEVAPGARQQMWTFGGTAPGPTLHGLVGDTFVVTLVNDGSMRHSIDFHAGSVAPDGPMRPIAPGESLVYRFQADFAGAWMYHCATAPMLDHIANGMYGAVVIDPPGLAPADHEYALVQSELYLGPQNGTVDDSKLRRGEADAVVFNGYVRQYDAAPLTAKPGERVRVWVLDAGPERASAFHIVGTQFDTVFKEGTYQLRPGNAERGGAQVLDLAPAQGGFVELVATEPGHYPILTHQIADAERGAHGVLHVS